MFCRSPRFKLSTETISLHSKPAAVGCSACKVSGFDKSWWYSPFKISYPFQPKFSTLFVDICLTDVCLHLAPAQSCILKVMLCWSRCRLLSVTWTWFMLLIKGHDHGESSCCLLPVQQLQKPEPPMSVVLERSKELQENVKSTDDTNKQCPVGCTPRSNMMYPRVRVQHKSSAYSENCHRLSWKG